MNVAQYLALLCAVLATVEMLHGIVRVRIIVPKPGRVRARQLSIVTGSLLAFFVCRVFVPSLGMSGSVPLLGISSLLAGFMAAFDIAVARLLMHSPWASILQDFDPRRGNDLAFGLLFLVHAPVIVMSFHQRP